MKLSACFALLLLATPLRLPCQDIGAPPAHVRISPELVEKLLIHRATVVCPHAVVPARVTGTVVVAIDVGKNGDVIHARTISGPAMLRKPILEAVRKYKYKPYLLNGNAIEMETTVSVVMDSFRDCPSN